MCDLSCWVSVDESCGHVVEDRDLASLIEALVIVKLVLWVVLSVALGAEEIGLF
jgi:hypothetical protein